MIVVSLHPKGLPCDNSDDINKNEQLARAGILPSLVYQSVEASLLLLPSICDVWLPWDTTATAVSSHTSVSMNFRNFI